MTTPLPSPPGPADDGADEPVRCSAKGCRAEAVHVLVWNNPKVHAPEREKTWVACEVHRTSLAEHLDVRGFLRRVEPLRAACPTCGASFPPEQESCPVCSGLRTGSCGGRE